MARTNREDRRERRRRRVQGLLLFFAAALCIGFAAPSNSTAAKVRIATPKEDLHVRNSVVRVKVRVRAGHFRAFVDGRKITKRFRKRGKSLRTAVLRQGRDFGPRDHVLTVRVGPRFHSIVDTVRFIALKRDDSTMDVSYDISPAGRGSDLLEARSDRRLWNTSRMPRVTLNGKRVDEALQLTPDDHGIRGGLGAGDGLRYGRNQLVIELLQRDGRYARDVHTFFVPRDRPLAGAGPDRTTGVGVPVRLDGSSTKLPPGLEASGTAYRWRIVRAPKRSKAKLRNPDGVRPRLKPDVPGTYVIRLTATPAGGGTPGIDEMTVTGPPTDSPMGTPIQTLNRKGSVVVGNHSYGSKRNGVLMVVLGATNLTPAAGAWGHSVQTFSPSGKDWSNGDKKSCFDLVTCVRDVDNKHIVILSGQGRAISSRGLSRSQAGDLQKAINEIGGTVSGGGQTPHGTPDLVQGDWSVLGNRTLVAGQAQQNYFLTQAPIDPKLSAGFPAFPADPGLPGSLNGFMQFINESAYQYISPEYHAIDTKWTPEPDGAPSPTQNTILVGDKRYSSESIPNGAIGFQVMVMSQSAPLRLLEIRTFVVLNPDCTTNQSGVKALDEDLGNWVNTRGGPTTAGSYLMLVQDFGRQSGQCWPSHDSPSWVNDDIPPALCNGNKGCNILQQPFGWNGQQYPNSTSDLFSSWDRLQTGGTVAGNLGKLAGVPFHDVVANYRRPVYNDNTKQTVNRDFGGLTVIASTHAYQWSSAFSQGQGDDPSVANPKVPEVGNGRVTGLLRRNEQSQWELEAGARGAGYASGDDNGAPSGGPIDQKSFFDLTFQPPTAWPCTVQNPAPCPNLPSEIRAAQRWFVDQLSPKSGKTTVRDLYPGAQTTFQNVSDIQRPYPNPGRGPGYFSPQVFKAMQYGSGSWPGLVGEVDDVNQVITGIQSWQNFFLAVGKANAVVDVGSVGQKIITDLRQVYAKLERQKADVDSGFLGDLMIFETELADVAIAASGQEETEVLSSAMGAASAGLALGNSTANSLIGDGASDGQGNVTDAADAIQDQVGQLSSDINKRYQAIATSLSHFGGIFVDDWGKLQQAGANFDPGGPWALTSDTVKRLGQSIAGQAQTAMYETGLPITYHQWMISPRKTNRNPAGPGELPAATGYQCVSQLGPPGPWQHTSTWGMGSIAWSGGGSAGDFNPGNSTDFTIRGLKSVADDLQPSQFSYYDQNLFGDVTEASIGDEGGTSAHESLMQPLFGTISSFGTAQDPGPLGADKEEVFGLPDWRIYMFQCGSPPLKTPSGVVDKSARLPSDRALPPAEEVPPPAPRSEPPESGAVTTPEEEGGTTTAATTTEPGQSP
jgi:hypothetical protein